MSARSRKDVGFDLGSPARFSAEAIGILKEDGYVLIGLRPRIAARPRAEQHDALKPLAIGVVERHAEAA